MKNWYVYPDPRARYADPYNPDRPPYPPDDFASRVLSPNPQKPTKKSGVGRLDGEQAAASLHHFLQERWKGVWPILYGDQLRQARLDDWIFQGLLDIEHLPEATA